MIKEIYKYYLPIIGLISFLLIWQLASTNILQSSTLLPSPNLVFKSLIDMFKSENLFSDLLSSLKRILIGFLAAFFLALLFGIVAFRFSKIYLFVRLTLNLLSSIPPIAWTPIAILWFGIGDMPAYFIVFLGAFFPMFSNFYSAINGVDQRLINVAKTLGVSSEDISESVIFPAILPHMFQGIKIGLTVAWFNVIAAELIGVNSGLGYKIQLNRELLASNNVIGLMLLVGLIGLMMNAVVTFLSNLLAPWGLQSEKKVFWIDYHRKLKKVIRKLPFEIAQTKIKDTEYNNENAIDILTLDHLTKTYQREESTEKLIVLKDISFKIRAGQVTSIVGPNGSGKSTIINIISGLSKPDGGTVKFQNEMVKSPSSERTVVFQDLALFPWQTSREHIAYSLNHNRNKGQTLDEMGYLKLAELENFADSYPFELSGGMQQRLAIMRAIAAEPKIILMDEPFASLDPLVRNASQENILKILKVQQDTTVLIVTHDIDEAIFMSDEVIVLSNRPTIVKEIVPVNMARPRYADTRTSVEFSTIRQKIWKLLNDDKPLTNTKAYEN